MVLMTAVVNCPVATAIKGPPATGEPPVGEGRGGLADDPRRSQPAALGRGNCTLAHASSWWLRFGGRHRHRHWVAGMVVSRNWSARNDWEEPMGTVTLRV